MLKILYYISAFQQAYETMTYYRFYTYAVLYPKLPERLIRKNREKAMFTTKKK